MAKAELPAEANRLTAPEAHAHRELDASGGHTSVPRGRYCICLWVRVSWSRLDRYRLKRRE